MKTKRLETDVLIIGGGTAGCFAAYTLGKEAGVSVLIAEKANIKRSGCLAAGVNALNAYITEGHVPQDYVDYAKKDAHGIVREDLLLSMSERLNHVTKVLDDLGLVILKDENGKYVARGNRNIKINGENIKPLLAEAAMSQDNVTVLERVNITDYIIEENEIKGAWGFKKTFSTISGQKQFFVRLVDLQGFTARTIRDFQDIRCGTPHLIQEPDLQWEF